jgi:ribonucleoside-diphosphate reductase alpha chain
LEKSWSWLQSISEEIFNTKYKFHRQSVEQVFDDIATVISSVEKESIKEKIKQQFYDLMISGKFLPAGRILANAWPKTKIRNFMNCFTIGIDDDMNSIYDALKEDAKISKVGGGVGFDVSSLRPKGTPLSVGGEASGPISFLRIFDASAKIIMTGGSRRAAHIALLDITHPDIEEFITCKQGDKNRSLTQFNISVKITDKFIEAVEKDSDWNLSFKDKIYKTVKAKYLYDLIVKNAYEHNEPGIFNIDTVNKYNNGYYLYEINECNPCGEQPIPKYNVCDLGALNLVQYVKNSFMSNVSFDFAQFEIDIATSVRFLDNVLDVAQYPLEKITDQVKKLRRIGLGFTGLGDTFAMMNIKYGSEESKELSQKIAKILRDSSYEASSLLAKEKGKFPSCDIEKILQSSFIKKLPKNIKDLIKEYGLRNIALNTVAPTGTISLTLGHNCSSGIEPIFALEYTRKVRTKNDPDEYTEQKVSDYAWLIYQNLFTEKLAKELLEGKKNEFFVTAKDISPKDGIDIQAIFQEYIDAAISKTLNLAPGTTFEQYKDLFMYAYKKGLKGFTTFNPEGSMKGILEYT